LTVCKAISGAPLPSGMEQPSIPAPAQPAAAAIPANLTQNVTAVGIVFSSSPSPSFPILFVQFLILEFFFFFLVFLEPVNDIVKKNTEDSLNKEENVSISGNSRYQLMQKLARENMSKTVPSFLPSFLPSFIPSFLPSFLPSFFLFLFLLF